MSLEAGSRVGPYEVLSRIGAGGMGEVYRARDTRLDRIVAIKSLPQAYYSDPERLTRITREARLLASLNHPNIGAIYGLEEVEGVPYLILEFVAGETLSSRLERGGLPLREAVDIGIQISTAMEAAHERGVIHRDLKPANVMITPSGLAKVLDFGLAKCSVGNEVPFDSDAPTSSGEGVLSGTAAYMSPEQARGRPLDRRTDVWSFGCILYECLAGRRPFSGNTFADVIVQVLERDPDWRAISDSAPAALLRLIENCLHKDAARRPKDLGEIRFRLADISRELASAGSSARSFDREPGADRSSPPSLAVLYFDNLSNDPDSDYFCAGMTEDILTDLSKVRGLRVASRTAVLKYRGATVDLAHVASELGVGTILEGSVRRAGDRVRITAQLINAADGFHLWAERYDRTLQDVFAVQEEIASSIAAALRIALTASESRELLRNRPGDVHAYDLYLKGRATYDEFTPEAFKRARKLFEKATERDPGYALAWAGIADCWGQALQLGRDTDREEATRRGLEAARRSIALDPTLAEGHKAEALVLLFAGDAEGSRAALLRAVRANPRHLPTLINLAADEVQEGDLAGAERLLRRAREVDPHDSFTVQWLANLCLWTGRYEEVLRLAEEVRRLSTSAFFLGEARALRIDVALLQGNFEQAERGIREGLVDGAEPDLMRLMEVKVAAAQGRIQEARGLLSDLRKAIPEHAWEEYAALAAAMCGEIELAIAMIQKIPLCATIVCRLDSRYAALLDRPEFAPRRSPTTLTWPLEAPPPNEVQRSLFAEVRIESGRPGAAPAGDEPGDPQRAS